MDLFTRTSPARPSDLMDTYWWFAAERQRIFFCRLEASPPPWTDDPVLRAYKFTNAYRASDRVSQYLIRDVVYSGDFSPEDTAFRTLLFKIFNRPRTWELLTDALGSEVRWATYSFERYDAILTAALERGEAIYSAAYIMPTPPYGYRRKHRNHLRLLEQMMRDGLPCAIASEDRTLEDAYGRIRSYPSIGSFLAYQFATDLNYGPDYGFSESEFVVPGPGAIRGIRKCFRDPGGWRASDLIRLVADRQEEEFERLEIDFRSLWGGDSSTSIVRTFFAKSTSMLGSPDPIFRVGKGESA